MRRHRSIAVAAGCALTLSLAACGKALPTAAEVAQTASRSGAAEESLSPTTSPPTKAVTDPVVWATYRMVATLDPVQAYDYPENTVLTTLCESVLRQEPDGTISPGLAVATSPSSTELVLTLRPGVRFWNGDPVTAADVVWSLKRAASSATSYYTRVFTRVETITADSPTQATIHLKAPDAWLYGELSQMAGIVIQRSYGERVGKTLGTPPGRIMCTGPYEIERWVPGKELVAQANPRYWDSTVAPRVRQITFKGVGDDASLTAGLRTGAIDGTYPLSLSTIGSLAKERGLSVSHGPSFDVDAMVITNLKGALGNVLVRRALSLAVDRPAYIQTVYDGHAEVPRTLANPGAWGYGRSVFEENWGRLPVPTLDLAKARALIKQAHAEGETITIGTTEEVNSLATAANVMRQAATEIGLKAKIVAVSSDAYNGYFESAGARKGIDMLPISNYSDNADPAALYNTMALPDGVTNLSGFSDPRITKALDLARSTANDELRARYTARAGDLIASLLPWIPLAAPDSVLVTRSTLTGAPSSFTYMGGPWANRMGGR